MDKALSPHTGSARPAGLIKAFGIWQKTSAQGRVYYVGRWGGAKIVILENAERSSESDPSHNVFLTEPTAPQGRTPQETRRAAPQRRRRTIGESRALSGPPLPDDTLDDLFREAAE